MRRIVLATGRPALFGAFLVAALLVLLPLRAALGWFAVGDAGLTAREARGIVWSGRLVEAKLGTLALGDLDAGLSPFALLIGRARVALAGPTLHGAATISRHAFGIDDMTATLPAATLFAPLPVTSVSLDEVSVRFRDGACEQATGRIRATLGGAAEGIALPPSVAGAVRCDGKALLVPLTSQAGSEGVSLQIEGDGRYHADLSVRPGDPRAAEKLQAAGFTARGDGYTIAIEGRLQ